VCKDSVATAHIAGAESAGWMSVCQRCGQSEAVVTVTRFATDAAEATVNERQLCGACAREERTAQFGPAPENEPAGAERFRPLRAHALKLLARLESTYDVIRSEAFPSSRGTLYPLTALEELRASSALPPVLLTPCLPEAAPLAVAFTMPPGLVVRCGHWHEAAFGAAFCSGEDSWTTTESEAERLDDLVGKVVDGLFAEAVRLPLVGAARLSATFGDGTPRVGLNGEGWMTIPRAHARALIGKGPRAVRWRPWQRRRPER
jgi:hypothetical protein